MTIDFDVVTKAFCGLNAISHVINNNYQSGDTIMKNYFTDSEDVAKYMASILSNKLGYNATVTTHTTLLGIVYEVRFSGVFGEQITVSLQVDADEYNIFTIPYGKGATYGFIPTQVLFINPLYSFDATIDKRANFLKQNDQPVLDVWDEHEECGIVRFLTEATCPKDEERSLSYKELVLCYNNIINNTTNNPLMAGGVTLDVVKYTKEAINAFLMHLEAINVKASVDGHYTTVVVQPIAVMYKSIKLD